MNICLFYSIITIVSSSSISNISSSSIVPPILLLPFLRSRFSPGVLKVSYHCYCSSHCYTTTGTVHMFISPLSCPCMHSSRHSTEILLLPAPHQSNGSTGAISIPCPPILLFMDGTYMRKGMCMGWMWLQESRYGHLRPSQVWETASRFMKAFSIIF